MLGRPVIECLELPLVVTIEKYNFSAAETYLAGQFFMRFAQISCSFPFAQSEISFAAFHCHSNSYIFDHFYESSLLSANRLPIRLLFCNPQKVFHCPLSIHLQSIFRHSISYFRMNNLFINSLSRERGC